MDNYHEYVNNLFPDIVDKKNILVSKLLDEKLIKIETIEYYFYEIICYHNYDLRKIFDDLKFIELYEKIILSKLYSDDEIYEFNDIIIKKYQKSMSILKIILNLNSDELFKYNLICHYIKLYDYSNDYDIKYLIKYFKLDENNIKLFFEYCENAMQTNKSFCYDLFDTKYIKYCIKNQILSDYDIIKYYQFCDISKKYLLDRFNYSDSMIEELILLNIIHLPSEIIEELINYYVDNNKYDKIINSLDNYFINHDDCIYLYHEAFRNLYDEYVISKEKLLKYEMNERIDELEKQFNKI